MAIPRKLQLGWAGAPRFIVDKGQMGTTMAKSPARQIVVRHGTVKMTDVAYDSLFALIPTLLLGERTIAR